MQPLSLDPKDPPKDPLFFYFFKEKEENRCSLRVGGEFLKGFVFPLPLFISIPVDFSTVRAAAT